MNDIVKKSDNKALQMLEALRKTIAPDLNDGEFNLFAETCKATRLNPVTKEVWAIKAGGRLQIMTGINGFLKIANSHPAFDGIEVEFERDGKMLVSATAKVHRKDRKFPSVGVAYMSEYGKPSPIWKQMPSVMLRKCALSLAIREAFIQELGGLYTVEEMPSQFEAQSAGPVDPVVEKLQEDIQQVEESKGPVLYDLRNLAEEPYIKSEAYLLNNGAEEIGYRVFKSSRKLNKLSSFITDKPEEELKANFDLEADIDGE